jgi:hypothetical protein
VECTFTEGGLSGSKRILFPVPLVILMFCVTQCRAPVEAAGGLTTAAGVPLPTGWPLQQSDRFGTNGNVRNHTELHAKYCEGEFYNVDSSKCLVRLPNVVINNQQVETSIVFSPTT